MGPGLELTLSTSRLSQVNIIINDTYLIPRFKEVKEGEGVRDGPLMIVGGGARAEICRLDFFPEDVKAWVPYSW